MLHLLFIVQLMQRSAVDNGDAFRQYALLFAKAGFGNDRLEIGAFLVRTDGGLRLMVWPHREVGEAGYVGALPANIVAIVHTHPVHDLEPSSHDREEAVRVRLPILVLTPAAVTVAWPDGTASYLRRGSWLR